jgi:hypothetical protein
LEWGVAVIPRDFDIVLGDISARTFDGLLVGKLYGAGLAIARSEAKGHDCHGRKEQLFLHTLYFERKRT